jgi:hypothetical protein
MKLVRIFYLAAVLGGFFFSLNSQAATRDVYFSAVGRNYVKTGVTSATSSRCAITIFNNSNVEQQYKLNMDASFSKINANANVQAPTRPAYASWSVIAAGSSVTQTTIFDPIPQNTANQTQDVNCAGTLTVIDTTTPGFVTASGALLTFYESGAQATLTSTTQNYGQQAVFTQVNVPINNGKPF